MYRIVPPSMTLALVLALVAAEAALGASPASAPAAADATTVSPHQQNVQIAELIKQLGDSQYFIRQQAQEELARLGAAAFDALTAAEHSDDIEVASRARYLVQLIRIELVRESDSPQVRNILQNYELSDETERRKKARQLAMLPGDAGVEALCRLIRFERSPALSKECAQVFLEMPRPIGDRWEVRAKRIESLLAGSDRPGAQWLRADIEFQTSPETALAKWERFVAAESAAEAGLDEDSNRALALGLQRRYVKMLRKAGPRDRATAEMRKMIASETGDPASLLVSTNWLINQQAWELVRELEERFKDRFDAEPMLLYMLAAAERSQGDTDTAEATAKRAFDLVKDGPDSRRQMAAYLKSWGMRDWSEREYRQVLESTPIDSADNLICRWLLGELLHDQQDELRAAEVLQELADAMQRDAAVLQRVQQIEFGMGPEGIRSRMNYFYACHWGAQNDRDKQVHYLEEGITNDPTDADVLIALYHASNDDPGLRRRALKLLHSAAEQFRGQIMESPHLGTPYNQYAWLIGNTEGDYDLAIQYSHTSLELDPDEAGLLDTLAHCYAAKGDYASAVMYQTRAVELEPHTLQIARALERFKAGLAKSSR